jgi:DNA helicase-2/ATP-dependent DNA helicase PcrA
MTNTQQMGGCALHAPARINESEKKGPDKTPAFPDEIAHLDHIKGKLDDAIKQANDSVGQIDKEYMDTKLYMVQYRGEIDPHEMFQNELALKQIDSRGAFAVEIRDKLAKLLGSPYFARIDFRETSKENPAAFYIGRFAFSHDNELLISDWRSPVASMFYDCEIGPAGYDAPAGRIDGELTRKRQFKIKNGEMEYALESSVNIQDDILQRELCHTSDEKMKSIIATIQKEQNLIIRNEKAGTLLIQGVAGSGKTSIALHRIAYLLYRFKDRLSAKNVTILSPNIWLSTKCKITHRFNTR